MLYAVFRVHLVRTGIFGVMLMILKWKRLLSLAKMIPVTSLIFWNGLRLDFVVVSVELLTWYFGLCVLRVDICFS